jgi:hypothetical protein
VMPRETVEAPPHQVRWNRPPRRTRLPASNTSRAPALLGPPTISVRPPAGLRPCPILWAKNNPSWPRTGGRRLGDRQRSRRRTFGAKRRRLSGAAQQHFLEGLQQAG